jgi:tetratricopeptide (TPR) repeat protein
MSIDMRPPFPVSLFSFPHVLGVVGYLGLIGGGFVLVIRYRDWRALAGLSVLLPALLFATEFSTVWVQDPFVLYRSYLWAIGLPGLVLILLHGASARSLALLGVAVVGLFAWQGLDRVSSLATMESIWTDAITKNPDDPRAVGRWFPYLSRGNIHLDAGRIREAAQDFKNSTLLGDRGMGLYNIAALLFLRKQYAPALSALDDARSKGYDFPGFNYQRAAILFELGRHDEAYRQLGLALAEKPALPQRVEALTLRGRAALALERKEDAVRDLSEAVRLASDHKFARYYLGMAYVMTGRFAEARDLLTHLLADGTQSSVYYARAMANYGLKNKAEALADIEAAIKLGPDNANFREWQAKIKAMK